MKKAIQKLLKELSTNLPDIPFEVKFWDGETKKYGDAAPAFILTFKEKEAAKNIFGKGTLGFGEEYTAGNIDVKGDFQKLVRLGIDPRFQDMKLSLKTKIAILLQHIKFHNTIKKSPDNIAHHYDLGNEFYKLYLDESMTYSCAYFRSNEDTLEQAQQQKYEHICRKLQLKEGETIIDVGCGWGGMVAHAVRHYVVSALVVTLSKQ